MTSRPDRIWYVSYGSNVNEARFLRYILGDADHRGARDATPPVRVEWATAPLRLCFGGDSKHWGGGVCFVDPDPAATAYVRAWDISTEQFEDVVAQENRLTDPPDIDWEGLASGPIVLGESWYSLLLPVDLPFATPDHPALTFTWTTRFAANPPVAAYRDTIAAGLADYPGLSPAAIDAYLDAALAQQQAPASARPRGPH